MIVPRMGIELSKGSRLPSKSGLASALFSSTQQRVLALLFGETDRSFYGNELIRLASSGSGSVQRELARLEASGLITSRMVGTQRHYRANESSPIFEELRGIIRKTVGLAEPLRGALGPLAKKILAAFVYGSVAKKKESARSDIDLLIVSDEVTYADVYSALEPLRDSLRRDINPTVYRREDLAKKLKRRNAFLTRVLEQPKIWLIGSERDLTP